MIFVLGSYLNGDACSLDDAKSAQRGPKCGGVNILPSPTSGQTTIITALVSSIQLFAWPNAPGSCLNMSASAACRQQSTTASV